VSSAGTESANRENLKAQRLALEAQRKSLEARMRELERQMEQIERQREKVEQHEERAHGKALRVEEEKRLERAAPEPDDAKDDDRVLFWTTADHELAQPAAGNHQPRRSFGVHPGPGGAAREPTRR